jgi:hypothetical protein
MKTFPKWITILTVDAILVGGIIVCGFLVMRLMLLTPEPNYLLIFSIGAILLFFIINFLYAQYRQLKTAFTTTGLIRPSILGEIHYQWSELKMVTIKLHELVINLKKEM